jgi:hypothetical protein
VESSPSRSSGLHEVYGMVLYVLFYVMTLSLTIRFIPLS